MNTESTVTITISRASAQAWFDDQNDLFDRLAEMNRRDPNYPTLGGYFEEFGHVKEMQDALAAALADEENANQ